MEMEKTHDKRCQSTQKVSILFNSEDPVVQVANTKS